MTRLSLIAAGLLLAATPLAYAQDITGVISFSGSADYEMFDGEEFGDWYNGTTLVKIGSLSAKVGVVVAEDVTLQFDAWAQRWDGEGTGHYIGGDYPINWNELDLGAAAHLTWRTGDYLIGLAGGLGRSADPDDLSDYYNYATLAVEGGYDTDELSVIGQAGLTHTIDEGDLAAFGSITATYYLTPDLSVSASASAVTRTYEGYPDDEDYRGAVGTQLRYKLEDKPLILSLGYTFSGWYGTEVYDDETFTQVTHRVTAGISIPFGAGSSTLRDLDRATGLTLNDPKYGLGNY